MLYCNVLDHLAERFKNQGPIAYVILVFLGLLRETIYYNRFDISITNYIDLSETIFFLFDVLLTAIFYSFFGALLTGLIKAPAALVLLLINWISKKWYNIDYPIWIVIVVVGAVLLFISSRHFDYLNCVSAYAGAVLLTKPENVNMTFTFGESIGLLFLFCLILIGSSLHQANLSVEEGTNVELKFNDASVDTAKIGNRLIGENRNYIFLYSKKDSSATVVNRSQLEYLRIIKGRTINEKILDIFNFGVTSSQTPGDKGAP